MRLDELAADDAVIRGDAQVTVATVTADSREVRPGSLFAALKGTQRDGLDFVGQAVAAGAVAILGDDRLATSRLPVPVLTAADPRRALARMAARLLDPQPRHVVAVTGTNGKTSTASFTAQLWRATGRSAASLGTLGIDAPGFASSASLTTPDPVALHATLRDLALAEVDHVVLEASSHGLDQRRLDGVRFEAAAFLNLTRDHLDYHGTEDAYLAAKWRLFEELLPAGAVAILNADMPQFLPLAEDARAKGLEVVDIGRQAQRFRLLGQTALVAGQELQLQLDGAPTTLRLPVVGAFQAYNLLAAIALAEAAGAPRAELLKAVSGLTGPRGRMELVATHPSGAAVFVDYAHTPDALEQALRGLRPHCQGRLIVVFGCGGDRDPGKRPLMGAVTAQLADRVIVTDDNPRSEDAASIRRAALAAAPGALEIGDRAQAIEAGIAQLATGGVLLVAGKGHEQGQVVGNEVRPFDDAEVVRRVLGPLGAAA